MVRTLLATCVLLTVASSAYAIPEFTEKLQNAAHAPCLPHCNVCHRDDATAEGSDVDRPFGLAMRHQGLRESSYSFDRAVANLQKLAIDSDGDGVPDIEELSMGEDPNDPYPTSICGPKVGCSLGSDAAGAAGGALPLLLIAWLMRRRRASIAL